MAPRSAGGVRGRARGAGRADDDPPDGSRDRRVDGRGCVALGLVVSGRGRAPWLGAADRRSRVGRLGSRSSAGGGVPRPPPVLTRDASSRPEGVRRRIVVGGGTTGGEATRALPARGPVLGRSARGGGSSLRPCRTTVTGVPGSPAARSLNPKRGLVGLRGPTITTRFVR